jgi:hypothetical protein
MKRLSIVRDMISGVLAESSPLGYKRWHRAFAKALKQIKGIVKVNSAGKGRYDMTGEESKTFKILLEGTPPPPENQDDRLFLKGGLIPILKPIKALFEKQTCLKEMPGRGSDYFREGDYFRIARWPSICATPMGEEDNPEYKDRYYDLILNIWYCIDKSKPLTSVVARVKRS